MRNSSIVVSLFQGQFCNRLMYMTCGKTSTSFDVFMCLSLPIPTNIKNIKRVDLEMCLKRFSFYEPFRDKLETTVHFPIRRLDLTPYVPSNSGDRGSRSNSQQMGLLYMIYMQSQIIMVD
ncbi:cysteine proteinase [Gigaspora margarita]|uniref:ubiquitinyl hydrolase 1 n=1 Tax=Gigaspora margarita TaxID=4874 RepID=A0A8H4EPD5_GIGMA|nr:cysteine proteinase [Gigaspora margarita]